jgi:hypothetical protein
MGLLHGDLVSVGSRKVPLLAAKGLLGVSASDGDVVRPEEVVESGVESSLSSYNEAGCSECGFHKLK